MCDVCVFTTEAQDILVRDKGDSIKIQYTGNEGFPVSLFCIAKWSKNEEIEFQGPDLVTCLLGASEVRCKNTGETSDLKYIEQLAKLDIQVMH